MSDALGLPLLIVVIALPSLCTSLCIIVCIINKFCGDGDDQVLPSAPPAAAAMADPEAGYQQPSEAAAEEKPPPPFSAPPAEPALNPDLPPLSPTAQLPPLKANPGALPPISS